MEVVSRNAEETTDNEAKMHLLSSPALIGVHLALLTIAAVALSPRTARAADPPQTLALWPGTAPGDVAGQIGVEHDTSGPDGGLTAGKTVIRLGNVSVPTITVYQPPKGAATGTAVVVCPGGGYSILAMDLEGTEVCDWLNSIGVTAVLLKYRVPVRKGQERYVAPLQDAQRALGLVRSHAKDWGIKPNRIGILGFSAGGHLSAALSTNFDTRSYPTIDAADSVSCRPDFTVLIYPAYLTKPDGSLTLAPEIHVGPNTPPAFLAQTEDDPVHVENCLTYYTALKNAHVPAEIHLYASGGHGYGLRPSDSPITVAWPRLAEAWMRQNGFIGLPASTP
jgi:acetyl esterase/lipase